MRVSVSAAVIVLLSAVLTAQTPDGLLVANPLDEIRDALAATLAGAGVPFTDAQEDAIALAMDEQRRATEQLFGQIFDFSGGPPQGDRRDRALAGIAFMTEAFLAAVDDVLTPPQEAVWREARLSGEVPARARLGEGAPATGAGTSGQIARIRIGNNPYTAATRDSGNEVITRGGVGAFHGNVNFTFQNHLLNARNPFAGNRPDYLQRDFDVGFNGPIVPERLTLNVSAGHNHQENVDTISAVTPAGLVSEGITRPSIRRSLGLNGQAYLNERQALHFSAFHNVNRQENQGIGGTTLRERAQTSEFGFVSADVRSLTEVSATTLLDVRAAYQRDRSEFVPVTGGVTLNVTDAFRGGGASNRGEGGNREMLVQALLVRTGDRVTLKTGLDVHHLRRESTAENGFNGEFEFASLDDFLQGTPTTYTLVTGEPRLDLTQLQGALFLQTDVRVSSRLTIMPGLRYDAQSNLDDRNNVDPRFGYAFALDDRTVLRGGVGLFTDWLFAGTVENLLRLDGERQQELVVRNPSYPNPFATGDVEVVPPSSVRVRAPDLEAQSELRANTSLERQLPGNVQVTVSYEFNRSRNRYRSVNLNAPRPGETARPDPTRGNVLELRSSGRYTSHEVDVSLQQRLRVMTVEGNYQWRREWNDSQGAFSLPSDNYDLAADWGRSNTRAHQFYARVNAQLPLGVFLTVRFDAQSGQPWTITTGRDDNRDTVSNDRPAGVPRNSETGPGYQSTSVNLSKVFYLRRVAGEDVAGAGMQVNVFANITNALNRSNLRSVSGALTSSRFGRPTSADSPREIEIGVRFQF